MLEIIDNISIDTEVFSWNDLKKGLYQYAAASEIMLLAAKYQKRDAGKLPTCYDTTLEELPGDLLSHLTDPRYIKWAWNAAFEIAVIEHHYKIKLDISQWRCSMDLAARCGLPLSLEMCAYIMKLDQRKDKIGSSLIRMFCIPQKPTAANGMKTRFFPWDFPKEWKQFRSYCIQDVVVEMEIARYLSFYPVSDTEVQYWALDQRMNMRGIRIDQGLATRSLELNTRYRDRLVIEAKELTGLSNPNSPKKLIEWLNGFIDDDGEDINSIKKELLPEILPRLTDWGAKRMIEIRQELSKTSVMKYKAMLGAVSADGRLRGVIQHYGAGRTGRAAGRLVQVHNLPKTIYKNLDVPRGLVLEGDAEYLELNYGAIPGILSKLLRTAFIASPGNTLLVSDFAAIEARIIAWLSGEEWRLEAFKNGVNIYSASASKMFSIPLEDIPKGCPVYDKGKIAELALGYNGSKGALIKMGAYTFGIKDDELLPIVYAWRDANKKIVALWKTFEKAAKACITTGETQQLMYGIKMEYKYRYLFITLPSGRRLSYYDAALEEDVTNTYGPRIVYKGMDQETNKWVKLDTYGGKLTENIVQAIARDLLYSGLLKLDAAGFNIVMHVHDEAVIDGKPGQIERVNEILADAPAWADGLPLGAEGFESFYYRK